MGSQSDKRAVQLYVDSPLAFSLAPSAVSCLSYNKYESVINTEWVSEFYFLVYILFVSGLYCCVTNYYKLSWLRQHPFISSQSWRSDFWHGVVGSMFRVSENLNRGIWPDWVLLQGPPEKSAPKVTCWQNSVPCDCKTEVPISVLAVRWRLLSAAGHKCYSLPLGDL